MLSRVRQFAYLALLAPGVALASGGAAGNGTAGSVGDILGGLSGGANGAGGVVDGAMSTAITALKNLEGSYPGLLGLLEAICYVGGLAIMIASLLRLSRLQQNETKGGIFVSMAIAVILIASPTMISSVAVTLFGSTDCSAGNFYQYMDKCQSRTSSIYAPVLSFVQFYGFYSFVRGWFLVNRSAKPGAPDPDGLKVKGASHILFGVLCIHIKETLMVLGNTFGFAWIQNIV